MTKKNYNWISDFVYGGVDGAVTTFAVVAGVEGASLTLPVILILGFANLFADGFSMSVGKYLSDKAKLDHYRSEKGMYLSEIRPVFGGLITFISFVFVGFIPLFAYVFQGFLRLNEDSLFFLTSIFTLAALFLVGAVKAKFTKTNWLKSGFQTLLIAGIAAAVAYLVGFLLRGLTLG